MDNVNIYLEQGQIKEVSGIYYIFNSKYYFIYTEKEIDENGYVVLYLTQVGKEAIATPTGNQETGFLVGVEIADADEWKQVQSSITKIVDNKRNGTSNQEIQYLPISMLSNLKIVSKKTFRLMQSVMLESFKIDVSSNQELLTTQPTVEQVAQPVVEQEIQPVIDQVAQPVVGQEVQPVIEQVAQPVVEQEVQPVIEQVAQPVVEQEVQPVIEQVAQPVVEQVAQPVVDQVAQSVVEPFDPLELLETTNASEQQDSTLSDDSFVSQSEVDTSSGLENLASPIVPDNLSLDDTNSSVNNELYSQSNSVLPSESENINTSTLEASLSPFGDSTNVNSSNSIDDGNVIIDYRAKFFEEQEKNSQLQATIEDLNNKLNSIKSIIE